MPVERKERLVRAMACALSDCTDYVFGPDMGTDEQCMAWVRDEIGRAVGLPRELGGIPLDELGATGFGLRHAAQAACEETNVSLSGARVVVQGFGSVGQHAARELVRAGARVVAVSDSRGAIINPSGLDVDALLSHKRSGAGVAESDGGEPLASEDLVGVDCEIWIPAARPDVLHEGSVDRLRARLVVSGANIPATAGAEQRMHERGIVSVPDFIANAGGVICAAMEYGGATQATAFAAIEERVRENTHVVLRAAQKQGIRPRQAAEDLAIQRVKRAMSTRRWSIF
jgi:glutamate dehydrogenase (NAD(P)+)